MAYGGGYLVKPVQSKNGSISELFLAGQAQVTAIRDKVREERRVQSEVLGKSTNFVATGIQDMDKYWANAGSQARTRLADLQQQNRDGFISRSDVIAQSAAITSEMKMIGQLPTIIKDQRDVLVKEIAKGGYSGLTLAEFDRTWFKNDAGSSYGVPVYDQGDGTKRPLHQNYSTELIEGKQYMKFEYEEINAEGGIDLKHIIKPLSSHINPSKRKYEFVDDKKQVSAWAKNLGDQNYVYTGANGTQQNLYSLLQTAPSGTNMMGRISDPKDVAQVAKFLEQEVSSKGDDWMASYAFDVLGARTAFGDGASAAPLSKGEYRSRFPSDIYFDYNLKTGKGTGLELNSDPLRLQVDQQGNTVLSDDTKSLVKAHYRNQLIASVDVDSEVYKDKSYASKARTNKNTNTSISKASYTNNGVGMRVNGGNMLSRIHMSQMRENNTSGSVDQISLQKAESSLAQTGKLDYGNATLPIALQGLDDEDVYKQSNQGAVNIGGVMSNLKSVLNISTFNDNQFVDITGYYTAEAKNTAQPIIVMTGNATYGKVSTTNASATNANNSTTTSGAGSFVGEGLSNPLTDAQAQNLYLRMWHATKGNPEMVAVFKRLGFSRNTRQYKEALHMAQNDINTDKTKKTP